MTTSGLPDWFHFLPQAYPSANVVLVNGAWPALFDTGYGSDTDDLFALLESAGTPPAKLKLVVNTHWHSDHVGGNHRLQREYQVPIAAARADAIAVNARRPDACLAVWLDQPIESYTIDRPLDPGERIAAGEAEWLIIPTPGHTPAHLGFFQPDAGILIAGDVLHDDDVGWINLALDGSQAIEDALRSLDRLAALPVRFAFSGHGPAIAEPAAALARARTRYEKMRQDPERAAWHGIKRIFAFALMIHDGIALDEVHEYLVGRDWLRDHASKVMNRDPAGLAFELLAEMRRIGAVSERAGKIFPTTTYRRPRPGWRRSPGFPGDWD